MTIQTVEGGKQDARTRKLVQFARLPDYGTSAERIARIATDIRELSAQMRAQLTAKAASYTVRGYSLDEESWEMASNGNVIILSVNVVRP